MSEFESLAEDIFSDLAIPFGSTVTFSQPVDDGEDAELEVDAICSLVRDDFLGEQILRDVMTCKVLRSSFDAETLTPVRGNTITDENSVEWTIRDVQLVNGWYVFTCEKDIRVVPR